MAYALVQCGQSRGEAFDTVYTTARGAEEEAERAQGGGKRRGGLEAGGVVGACKEKYGISRIYSISTHI
jgi:hypothetical protein